MYKNEVSAGTQRNLYKNKEERYSRTSTIRYPLISYRLSDTRYSANGQIPVTQLKLPKGNACKQGRTLISICGYVGDLRVMGVRVVKVGVANFLWVN